MGTHWAIAIGINQYEHFQPLMYAQRDAQMLHQFLRTEAGFPPHQCLLFSDLSASIEPDSISPTRDTILNVVSQLCQKLQPDDVLLLFFCGYGVRFKDKDYLMTLESDPTQMPHTGIEMSFLFNKLKTAATRQIFLMFDVGRSQGTLAGDSVGEQTLQLAQTLDIATFLSCQPQQFSYETLALRQGLYAAGLLEAFRYGGCVTPEQLATYLAQRLPQLCEYHWRPAQDPVAFIPPEMRYTLLIPSKGDRPLNAPSPTGVQSIQTGPPEPSLASAPQESANSAVAQPLAAPIQTKLDPPVHPDPGAQDFWRRLLTWGVPLAAVLCAGVLITHGDELFGPGASSPEPSPTLQATPDSEATTPSQPTAAPTGSPAAVTPTLQGAQTALSNRQFAQALTVLDQVPADQRNESYQALLNQAAEGVLQEARAVSDTATEGNRASVLSLAIQQARQLRPEHPFYLEAQRDIQTWSQGILDVAVSRASQPNQGDLAVAAQNFRAGILAAQLVPPDQSDVYANAQREIATWSRGMLDLVNEHARSNNFQAAIATAQQLPSGTPDYEEAQRAIARWRSQ